MTDVTLGDMVIYTLPTKWRGALGQREWPGIVHKINSDETADLTVFTNYGQSVFQNVPRGSGTPDSWSPSDTLLAD